LRCPEGPTIIGSDLHWYLDVLYRNNGTWLATPYTQRWPNVFTNNGDEIIGDELNDKDKGKIIKQAVLVYFNFSCMPTN